MQESRRYTWKRRKNSRREQDKETKWLLDKKQRQAYVMTMLIAETHALGKTEENENKTKQNRRK